MKIRTQGHQGWGGMTNAKNNSQFRSPSLSSCGALSKSHPLLRELRKGWEQLAEVAKLRKTQQRSGRWGLD